MGYIIVTPEVLLLSFVKHIIAPWDIHMYAKPIHEAHSRPHEVEEQICSKQVTKK